MLCGNNYTKPNGYIVSPGHPNNYPRYADCDYLIVTNQEAFVSLHFLDFDLESKEYIVILVWFDLINSRGVIIFYFLFYSP